MTTTAPSEPRTATLRHDTAMRLAATEYQRFADLLRSLRPDDWAKPTDCPDWDVRAIASHLLGEVEFAASMREQRRQLNQARRRGGPFVDAWTGLQVEERAGMTPAQIVQRFVARAPKAVRGRRRLPGLARRRRIRELQRVGDHDEAWTLGYLVDIIFNRDPWMHRIDIVRATGADHVLTADHDGVIVADIVAEWAAWHGQPYTLLLTGPAGGEWSSGEGGPTIEMDAVEFCRVLSGRGPADGLLTTAVPF
jgi:uncharacterized protein (TIGR03083 family)